MTEIGQDYYDRIRVLILKRVDERNNDDVRKAGWYRQPQAPRDLGLLFRHHQIGGLKFL